MNETDVYDKLFDTRFDAVETNFTYALDNLSSIKGTVIDID